MNANLSYLLTRMQGVSTQNFRINPQTGSSPALPGAQIRIPLPSNTLLNTRSAKMFFRVTTNAATVGARLPPKIESLIDRVTLECGGTVIDGASLQQYNTLCHAKAALEGSRTDSVLGHPEMVRQFKYHTLTRDGGAAIATNLGNETYATAGDDFAMSFDLGFMGTCQPSIIDTSLLPDMVLVIQLAGTEVMSSVAGPNLSPNFLFSADGAGGATFALNDIRMTVECLGLGGGTYDAMVQRAIAERGNIDVPFVQYSTTIDTHATSTKFHVTTQSLDRIWVVFRQDGYNTQGAPVIVSGYKTGGGAFVAATSAGAVTVDIGKSQYDIGGNDIGANKEKYVGKYFNFSFGAPEATIQLQLNGALAPGYPATTAEAYALSKNSVDAYKECPIKTLDQYRQNYSVFCYRMCLPDSHTRELSGTDTRATNLAASVNTQNIPAQTNVVVYSEHTSTLQIGAQKQFAVVN